MALCWADVGCACALAESAAQAITAALAKPAWRQWFFVMWPFPFASALRVQAARPERPVGGDGSRQSDIVIRKNLGANCLQTGLTDSPERRIRGLLRSSAMAMDASEIERLIKARIPDAQVTIRDLAGDGDHYAATVISASFKGKSRVQQHQLVYEALKGQMGGVLHALALQTATPEG
jgi:stress-induced morphogen